MESSKNRSRKNSCSSSMMMMNTKKHSLTAQLTRTVRRFSAAVAPHFTKLDPLPLLQNYHKLNMRMVNIAQLQAAVERYVIKNSTNFNPIDFEITDAKGSRVLSISLYPEEMVLFEGTKRIFSITFDDSDPEEYGTVISKIRHPLSGMRVFEFIKLPCANVVQISSYVDQCNRCQIELWIPQADNELRMIVVAYAMTQMVREVFPSLNHIMGEQLQQGTGKIFQQLIQ
uniref:Uncharacterized protein n=1 Tax=Setaria digitata TaxID=48799 RepID=A0A915PXL3_9BILA